MADTEEKRTIRFIKGNVEKFVSATDLRNEISQCLQIENLNFLIGSGCSSYLVDGKEMSIPTMAGLAEKFYAINPNFKYDSRNKAVDNKMFKWNLEALIQHLISLANIISSEKGRKTPLGRIKNGE